MTFLDEDSRALGLLALSAQRIADRLCRDQRVGLVPQRGVFIRIDVAASGKLAITLWRGEQRDASYAPVLKARALSRCLPEAIDEAIAFAQSGCGSDVITKTSLNSNCSNAGPPTGPRGLTL